MSDRILLLSPDTALQRHVQLLLDREGLLVVAAARARDARRAIALESLRAVVVDGRVDGAAELVSEMVEAIAHEAARADGDERELTPVFGLVDTERSDRTRELLAAGALDVVPVELIHPLLVHRLLTVLRASAPPPPEAPAERRARRKEDVLVGHSPAMVALGQQIDMVAKTDLGAAIFGETGTGKELVARTLHAQSARARKPFVVANCTALPETLFENELFGHERGAFTGADQRQFGLIDEADGGTVLLDEIGDVAPGIQAKLLRLLQFREYKRVGGTKTFHADVRILTTTHRDLSKLSAEGKFREDLYYRLNTLQLVLPPLRDRLVDIPLLVDHFVRLFNERERREFVGFTPAAVRALQGHHWPGNVRELQSVVDRSLVMAGTARQLDVPHLRTGLGADAEEVDVSRPFAEARADVLNRFERGYLAALLRVTGGNLSLAARRAQHERKSLWLLLRKHGLDPREYRRS